MKKSVNGINIDSSTVDHVGDKINGTEHKKKKNKDKEMRKVWMKSKNGKDHKKKERKGRIQKEVKENMKLEKKHKKGQTRKKE